MDRKRVRHIVKNILNRNWPADRPRAPTYGTTMPATTPSASSPSAPRGHPFSRNPEQVRETIRPFEQQQVLNEKVVELRMMMPGSA
jgi:hypothetical protein